MRPRASAVRVYAFSLLGRGWAFGVDGVCKLLEARSRGRRGEAWFNRLEEWVVMP